MRKITEALDQYTGICKEAIVDSATKLSKSFEKVIIEILLLYMIIPGKINFTLLGRDGRHYEQCYRKNFGRRRSKSINWLRFNIPLSLRYFGGVGRMAIAIDPSFISKVGKKTPHIGRFWSGSARCVLSYGRCLTVSTSSSSPPTPLSRVRKCWISTEPDFR